MKQWYTSNPKEGDIIFFKNSERICHVGIVTKVTSTTVYTVEGNTSSGNDIVIENGGCVAEKSYKLNNTRIAGYGRPKYDDPVVEPKKEEAKTTTSTTKVTHRTYKVVKGDNLSKISLKLLGKANGFKEIMELNGLKSTVINIGQVLKVPVK